MKFKLTVLAGIVALSGCTESGEDKKDLPTTTLPNNSDYIAADPTASISDSSAYNDFAVHDPSVIKADGAYYVFGSHFGVAKTTNLMTWEAATRAPFDDYETEAAEGIAWSDGFVGNWAANVIQAPNGKFWFYYNHCAFDNPNTEERDEVCWHRSYMGLAEADSIEGPYVNKGLFLRTGHTDEEIQGDFPVYDPATGENLDSYNPAVHPNGIDPTAFYDKDGNLWMIYGSYSGGIYILAMDETSGMPEPDQGFGKHLVGGDFNAIEGSFMMYSPESDYYYLFWSYAGFAADGGYNIRVARAKTPDGPFLDAAGNDMVNARTANNMGNKLMGSHLWTSSYGDPSAQYGYNAPGHNSALYDAELGKHLLFTHTRFPQEEGRFENIEAHSIRIHEMWINSDGWLVASPHRYAPIEGENIADPEDIAGDYRLILQGNDSNNDEHESVYVTLTNQGRYIQGQVSGSYRLYPSEGGRVSLTIDDVTYKGHAKWQWNVEDQRLEVVISAMSSAGESVFAAQLPEKSVSQIVDDISLAIDQTFANPVTPGELLPVTKDLNFSTEGARGATISWSTSHPRFVSSTGKVTRPNVDEGDTVVTLTANVELKGQTATITKDVKLIARSTYNRTAHYSFDSSLTDGLMNFDNAIAIGANLTKPESADVEPVNADIGSETFVEGQVGQAVNLDGSYGILLPNNIIASDQYTVSFWMNERADMQFSPALFVGHTADPFERWISFLPSSWDANLMVWARHDEDDGAFPWFDAVTGVAYPDQEWHHVAYAYNQGSVEVFFNGESVGTGSGLEDFFTNKPASTTISLGVNYWNLPLNAYIDEFKVYDDALSAAEIKALDVDILPADQLLSIAEQDLDLGNLNSVIDNLILPHTGPFASALSWSSSDDSVINPQTGEVTRPERGQADVEVTLTATITLDGQSTTKEFVANVISKTPPAPVARFSFEDNVEDTTGNFAAGEAADKTETTPLITPSNQTLTYAPGVVGSALDFKGDEGPGVKLPNGLIQDYSYTISLWLNPTVKTQFTTAFFGYAASNSWVSLVPFGPGAGDTMLWSGEAWFDGTIGSQIPAGEWSHVVLVVNEGVFNAYLNGELVNTLNGFPDVFTPAGANSKFALATNLFPVDANYNGLMDELVIYDDPISVDDVQALYSERSAQ
ncbi:LamG-like jellyroll fold domain-containing protein [Catenovulum sediminis]|uniref:LamG-like jellyroll fold domain-containing protein n=1 Tax=Catenovulum sediminis TaxID=1740262 RepID=A0ABV1RD29_9ALTE|nr:LamG-like jellyroll fold domain-containing protein [Catenovulum sediminis]